MFCNKCGKDIDVNSIYCKYCGNPIAAQPSDSPPQQGTPVVGHQQPVQERPRKKSSFFKKLLGFLIIVAVFFGILTAVDRKSGLYGYMNPGFSFPVFNMKNTPDSYDDALTVIGQACFEDTDGLFKWTEPIRLLWAGTVSEKDFAALEQLIAAFNTVEGFPGIELVYEDENVVVCYADNDEEYQYFASLYPNAGSERSFCTMNIGLDGAIISAAVVLQPGGMQGYRNSVLAHEFFHLVGFMGHTDYRQSILNTTGPVFGLCDADILAFRMIYNPDIFPGTSYADIVAFYENTDIAFYTQGWKN